MGKLHNWKNGAAILLAMCLNVNLSCGGGFFQESGKVSGLALNVVFILADDLGYGELGCFGQQKIRTPHLDQLAAEGLTLRQHYSGAPVCAPSRCVLMTGMNLAHAEIRGNRDSGNGRAFPGQFPVSESAVTFVDLLQANGYATGGFGKWGLGPTDTTGSPLRNGFDHFFGYNCQRLAHSYYPEFLDSDNGIELINSVAVPGHQKQLAGEILADEYRAKNYAPEIILNRALDFIETNRDRKFFLYLPFVEPHVAMHPPQDWVDQYPLEWDRELGPYRGENGYLPHPRSRAAYAAMISHLDDHVGRVVAALKSNGLYESTLIVFTSDNGATHGGSDPRFSVGGAACEFFNSNGGLRGAKGSCYEGGIRVPCIVRWPGVTTPSSGTDIATYFPDWFPTICGATGAIIPEALKLDGLDLRAVLAGGRELLRREPMIWDFAEYGGIVAVRSGDWKAIRRDVNKDKPKDWELYNIASDPGESNDIAHRKANIVVEMEKKFLATRIVEPDFANRVYDPISTNSNSGTVNE